VGQHSFSDQEITQYLLGSVSETEELDELSVADDEFAARLQSVENDLVDAYVRGELSGKTLENFDSHYLASPRRRAKVLIAQGLKDILEPAAGGEHVRKPAVAARDRWDFGWASLRQNFLVPKLGLQVGLAAALLLILVAGGWLAVNNFRLRQQANHAKLELADLQRRERELLEQITAQRSSDEQKARELADMRDQIARLEQQATDVQRQQSPRSLTPYIVSFALAPQRRSTSQIPTIAIPTRADYVVLHLELEAGNYAAYRAELKQQPANQVVWRSSKLRASDAGSSKEVVVTLRPGLIKAERHTLDLSGVSNDGQVEMVGSYLFVVTKP